MSTLADLQSQLDALKAEVARLREETSLFFTIHRDDDGQVSETQLHCWVLHCEAINLRERNKQDSAGMIGVDEDGGYVSLWGTSHRARVLMRVTGDTGEFELFGQDDHPVARIFEHEGHGHMAVLSEGNVPRVIMKGMEDGGTLTALDPEGKPLAIVNSLNGRGGVVVLEKNQVRAQMTSNEAGGFISTANADQKKSCVIASGPAGNTIRIGTPEGRTGVSLAATNHGSIVSIGDFDENSTEASVTLSHLPNLGGNIVVRDSEHRESLDLSTDEEGGSIQVNGNDGAKASLEIVQGGGQVRLKHQDASGEAMMAAAEGGALISARGKDDVAAIVNVSPNGGSFSLNKGSHVQFFAGLADDKQSGVVSLNAPDNSSLVRMVGAPEGGLVLLSGKDGITQAGLAASEAGGSATVFSELGVERATLRSADDGGGLHLKWGGTTALVAAATERGGIVTAHGPDGKVVETLPDLENFHEDEDD